MLVNYINAKGVTFAKANVPAMLMHTQLCVDLSNRPAQAVRVVVYAPQGQIDIAL